jgi:SAM-dependent methyltransferase
LGLDELQRTWDALGREDPMGVILDYPLRLGRWEREEFFATGEREIDAVLRRAERFGVPRRRERALDFGCGVGRLTQAMCGSFAEADGVDIAPSMVEAAQKLNRHGERCRYHLSASSALPFDDRAFDFVYSNITLQHMPPALASTYVFQLGRVLGEDGLLAFQLPSGRREPRKLPRKAALAELSFEHVPVALRPGEETIVRVRVRNAGDDAWRPAEHGELNVGDHWRDAAGRLVRLDDGRAPLPGELEPGAEAEVELPVTAPDEPGDYLLEVDVVQEGVAWFAKRRRLSRQRTTPPRAQVTVAAGAASEVLPVHGGSPPRMEMHAVPREEVLALLARSGLDVLDVDEDDASGPGWISLSYMATRS